MEMEEKTTSTENANDGGGMQTERENPRSAYIDRVSTEQLCRIINEEDSTVAHEVSKCIPSIAHAIDVLAERVRLGGRVIYVGAGTSGRLGVLDASEIPPTYSAPPDQFVGVIAGGERAIRSSVEGAEDSSSAAVQDLVALQLNGDRDCVVGIAASGRTPYVISSLEFAKARGCFTLGIACAKPSAMFSVGCADIMIEVVTGAEVVTGSTRMKAGTATKLVLNMLSTGIMIKMGKTYGNIMVDVKPSNTKLQERARRILRKTCGPKCPILDDDLDSIIVACDGNLKVATIVISLNESKENALKLLNEVGGVLSAVLEAKSLVTQDIREDQMEPMQRFYLCVDGGGTKTSVTIFRKNQFFAGSEVGPCNITEIGVRAATSQILFGIHKALDSLVTASSNKPWLTGFAGVWIAIAGCDRAGMRDSLIQAMRDTVPLQKDAQLQVTNDVELLAAVALRGRKCQAAVVLVAGTGSVAMAFHRSGNAVECIGRTGGWGPLLGDDGSGFWIGRQAIRHCLHRLESSHSDRLTPPENDLLTKVVLEHYGLAECHGPSSKLLDALLNPVIGRQQDDLSAKTRIAECAKPVVESITRCADAATIVASAHESLIGLIQALSRSTEITLDESALVLAGGLTKSDEFTSAFEERLEAVGIHFQEVAHNRWPAWSGAAYLAERAT